MIDREATTTVQCGWCPVRLPNEHVEWYHHFLIEHGVKGYSIRCDTIESDWDIAELIP